MLRGGGQQPRFYRVKFYPLTEDVAKLSKVMAAERIPRPDLQGEGNVHPGGAVDVGLRTAIGQMPWSKDKDARRVIVLVGDSRITPGAEAATAKLAGEAKAHGYQIDALVANRQRTETWVPVLEAAGGKILSFQSELMANRAPLMGNGALPAGGAAGQRPGQGRTSSSVFEQLAVEVIRGSVSKEYQDRVEPLVHRLIDYAEAMEAAEAARQ